jgi:hypothetical protein
MAQALLLHECELGYGILVFGSEAAADAAVTQVS